MLKTGLSGVGQKMFMAMALGFRVCCLRHVNECLRQRIFQPEAWGLFCPE